MGGRLCFVTDVGLQSSPNAAMRDFGGRFRDWISLGWLKARGSGQDRLLDVSQPWLQCSQSLEGVPGGLGKEMVYGVE